jgi:hypothetical protein
VAASRDRAGLLKLRASRSAAGTRQNLGLLRVHMRARRDLGLDLDTDSCGASEKHARGGTPAARRVGWLGACASRLRGFLYLRGRRFAAFGYQASMALLREPNLSI